MENVSHSGPVAEFDVYCPETDADVQMVFLIDLPILDNAAKIAANKLTPFAQDLAYFLEAQGIPDSLTGSLAKYDWSETERYGFVHSM